MKQFADIQELLRTMQRGASLLEDMFKKRKTVSIRYDDALVALNDDENRLNALIDYGVVVKVGDRLELADDYLNFFEKVLVSNEDIDVASVRQYIDNLKKNVNLYLQVETEQRKPQYLREVKHIFRSINMAAQRNAVDLRRNVNITYKQEPDFGAKRVLLRDFDNKRSQIIALVKQTLNFIDEQTVFFKSAPDVELQLIVKEVRQGLNESVHELIDIGNQIVDYLNRIEYQSRQVKIIRQLKNLKDLFLLEACTNIRDVMQGENAVWMERRPKYSTWVSLDFLFNDDAALPIIERVRSTSTHKARAREHVAEKIDSSFFNPSQFAMRVFRHQELFNAFCAQGTDLFNFVWNYPFKTETTREERLVLFLQLASQYQQQVRFTGETRTLDNLEYPIILSK